MATNKGCSTKARVLHTRASSGKAHEDQVGLAAKHEWANISQTDGAAASQAREGATLGSMIGAAIGATGGAAVGLGILAGVIPVIGPELAIGTLGTILLNATGGAAIAGLAGGLIGSGIPEAD